MGGVLHLTDCESGGVPAVIDAILDHLPGQVGFIGSVPCGFRNHSFVAFALGAMRSKNPLLVWATYRHLERYIKKCTPEIIHGHSSFGGFFGALLSRRFRIPFVYTPHATPAMIPGLSFFDKWITRLEWVTCKSAKVVLACSPDEQVALLNLCPAANVQLQPNGVEISFEAKSEADPFDWDIINIGRISAQKRPDFFVDLADRLCAIRPGTRVAWVGPGDTFKSASVDWIGEVSEAEVVRILNRARIFVSTSDYEGLSLAALRAAGAGCLLGLRDTPGNRAPVQLGGEGFLFSDPSEGALKLMQFLQEKDSAQLRFARSMKSKKIFSLDHQIEQLREVYFRVCGDQITSKDWT